MDTLRDPSELKFLYRTCSVPPAVLSYWITQVPEFYDKLLYLKRSGSLIDNKVLLCVVTEIYESKIAHTKQTGDRIEFSFPTARRTINLLKRTIESRGDNS